MSVQTDFVELATGIFSGRVYPQTAPAETETPYCTYTRVAAVEQATLDANGGTGNPVNTRMQLDVWAASYGEGQDKAAALKSALKGWGSENIVIGESDGFEPETKLYRVMLDVSIWHL